MRNDHCTHWLNESLPCCDCGDDSDGDNENATCTATTRTCSAVFDEHTLRADIAARWGEHGAHIDVFDHMVREIERLRAENTRLTTFLNWQEGDRVITVADTTGPAGTIPAGTTGTIHQAAKVVVLLDGEDFPCIFGPNGRDPGALAAITPGPMETIPTDPDRARGAAAAAVG